MNVARNPGFFGAIASSQSYLNIVYLLLALPLGIFYFTFLAVGLSLGAGLFVTLAGIPILFLVLVGSSLLVKLERILAIKLLRVEIPRPAGRVISGGLWSRTKTLLSDRLTWTGALYLLFKLPIGAATFTVAVTLLAVSIAFAFAPAYMWLTEPLVWGDLILRPYPWAWILAAIGIPMVLVSIRVLNATAAGLANMTKAMLGKTA